MNMHSVFYTNRAVLQLPRKNNYTSCFRPPNTPPLILYYGAQGGVSKGADAPRPPALIIHAADQAGRPASRGRRMLVRAGMHTFVSAGRARARSAEMALPRAGRSYKLKERSTDGRCAHRDHLATSIRTSTPEQRGLGHHQIGLKAGSSWRACRLRGVTPPYLDRSLPIAPWEQLRRNLEIARRLPTHFDKPSRDARIQAARRRAFWAVWVIKMAALDLASWAELL